MGKRLLASALLAILLLVGCSSTTPHPVPSRVIRAAFGQGASDCAFLLAAERGDLRQLGKAARVRSHDLAKIVAALAKTEAHDAPSREAFARGCLGALQRAVAAGLAHWSGPATTAGSSTARA
jgi:hypothetical protein